MHKQSDGKTGESPLWLYDLAKNHASIGQCEIRF